MSCKVFKHAKAFIALYVYMNVGNCAEEKIVLKRKVSEEEGFPLSVPLIPQEAIRGQSVQFEYPKGFPGTQSLKAIIFR